MPNDAPQTSIADLDGLRVATAYPVSTKMLLDERGIEAELVPVSGSVEATPRLGLADAIVDLVSTGSTASANGLRLIGTLLSSQAVLIGGRGAVEEQHDLVERLELMLSGVVAARRRRYVMMNATTETLPAIRAVLPSMGAPTVLELADEGAIAVHAAVAADDVWALAAGAARCRRDVDPRPADRAARAVRGAGLDDAIAVAAPIVADVRDRGDAALLEWTERFDGPRPDGFRVSPERIAAAAVVG